MAGTLTESEVERLVNDWYRALDVHAPVEELFPMLADGGLEMRFPEGTFRGHQGAEVQPVRGTQSTPAQTEPRSRLAA